MKYLMNRLFNDAMHDCISKALGFLERNVNARMFDCGCGDGEITLRVAEIIGTSDVYGVDIDEKALSVAGGKGIKVYKADINLRLPFEDNFFDVIFSNQVIEHLDYPDNFVREAFRVLKIGGYVVVATENLASWHNIFALLLGYQDFSSQGPSSEYRIGNPLSPYYKMRIPERDAPLMHKKVFAYRSLKEIFEIHGFKVERACRSRSLSIP
jgi:ubiquinone/menaquinone biosynthesis C-methylase UbiE